MSDPTEQITRIHALLDAFAAVDHGALFLHESSMPHMAIAVEQWATDRKFRIEAQLNHAHGRTYESWDICTGVGLIHAFPLEVGLLKNQPDLTTKIERIRKEADERIKALCAEEMKVTP